MTTDNIKERAASLEALLVGQTEGPEAALERLRGLSDADSFRRRLAFLVQLDRINEARLLVRARPIESEWIEQGVRVAVLADDTGLALELLEAAPTFGDVTGTLQLRC